MLPVADWHLLPYPAMYHVQSPPHTSFYPRQTVVSSPLPASPTPMGGLNDVSTRAGLACPCLLSSRTRHHLLGVHSAQPAHAGITATSESPRIRTNTKMKGGGWHRVPGAVHVGKLAGRPFPAAGSTVSMVPAVG